MDILLAKLVVAESRNEIQLAPVQATPPPTVKKDPPKKTPNGKPLQAKRETKQEQTTVLREATAKQLPFREEDAVSVAAQPGDVLFFGPYTVHASIENLSTCYRRVLINGYAYPGANHRIYPGDGAGRRLTVSPS